MPHTELLEVNKEILWLSAPHMSGNEKHFVSNAFETNWIAGLGPNLSGFEDDISAFYKPLHKAAALISGTSALHLALEIKRVRTGDYVLCQSFTFSASANPVVYQGATPVFIGSDKPTWNMDPTTLEDTIRAMQSRGKVIKAIIPVHTYGMPAQIEAILEIANRYEIPVIEDAAESLGSHIRHKMTGTFGEIGILSFNGNKIITTGGGGALISANEEYVKMARFLATQARDPAPHYQHSHIGYNYRLSNVSAGIGRGQMMVLPQRIDKRRRIYNTYVKAFSDIPEIEFLAEPEGYFSNRWLTCVLVNPDNTNRVTRETIRIALEEVNIEARPLWKPMHMQPVFKDAPYYGSKYEEFLFDRGLCLPSGTNMSSVDQQRVIDIVRRLMLA